MTYTVHESDSRDMVEPDASVDLVVTSPPYNVGIDYADHDDSMPDDEYLALLRDVFSECYRVLRSGGRMVTVVGYGAGVPIEDRPADVRDTATDAGFDLRDRFVWDKGANESSSAWGSWRSPSNPRQIFNHEAILTFFKDKPDRTDRSGKTIRKSEFLKAVKSVWRIPYTADDIGVDHPAPFPKKLARRAVDLYSFPDDTVLDPFAGSGTALVAAIEADRDAIGYDTSAAYVDTARRRCKAADEQSSIADFG